MSQQSSAAVQTTSEKVGATSHRRNRGRGRPCRCLCCPPSVPGRGSDRLRREIEEGMTVSAQRAPDTGMDIWERERAFMGCYDPSFEPQRDGYVNQGARRQARKTGRRAVADALQSAYLDAQGSRGHEG